MPTGIYDREHTPWPRGQRRNPDPRRVVRRVVAVCDRQYGRRAQLCRDLGVDRKTLWRWLSGHDWPGPEHTRRLERWVATRERT